MPLARLAAAQSIPLRTARRWLGAYRRHGLAGLARKARSDALQRRFSPELIQFIEGLALTEATADGCWDYDMKMPPNVVLVGKTCDDVNNGTNVDVEIYFGCASKVK